MKHLPIAVLTLSLSFAVTIACSQPEAIEGKVVGPGVTWSSEFRPQGPLNINVMRVQVDNPLVTVETESGQDRLFVGEKTLESVKREEEPGRTEIIGGVNADFWASFPKPYSPIGLLVSDGMIFNMPAKTRSAFVFTEDETSYIGPVSLEVSLQGNSGTLNIDRINSGTKSDKEIVLFTHPYGETVESAAGTRYVVEMLGEEFLPNQPVKVKVSAADAALLTPLDKSRMVVHIPPGRAEEAPSFSEGEIATLSAVLPQVKGVVTSVCGGGPAIVNDGKVNIADEGMGESFSETKHPRTALGLSKDGRTIYLVTIDGRQPRISVGVSLDELAAYMVELGCWQAINLDGGGSTSMVVNDKVVNKPSDFRGPRIVANSLLVVAEAGSGKASTLSFDPSGRPLLVPAGTTVLVEVSALDENSIPVDAKKGTPLQVEKTALVKSTRQSANKSSITFSDEASSGEISFTLGGASGTLPVKTVKLDKITAEPSVIVLGSGDTAKLDISGIADGQPISLTPEMVEITPADNSIVSIKDGVVKGLQKGQTELLVKIGSSKTAVPVYIDMAQGRLIEDFESIDSLAAIVGTQFDETATNISLEPANVKQGKSSGKIDYVMTKGGKTRINIPIDATIEEAPAGLGIWVFGDGQEAWLRANLVDNNGTLFIADFTNGADGITWNGQWKHITVPYQALIGTDFSKSPRPVLPLKVEHLVIAQDQEAHKKSGAILLDGFEALYPPQPAQNNAP
jgi:hypothetical protein